MVRHPINTLKDDGACCRSSCEYSKNIWHTARERWDRGINSNDINERGAAWGETAGDIAQAAIGAGTTKGIAKVSAKEVSRVAKVVQTARAVSKNSVVLGRGEIAVKELMGAAGENQLINFTKGVEVIKTTKDLNLYRYFGGTVTDIGPYLSNGPIGRFIDRRGLALKPEWNNTMEGLAEIQVPKVAGRTMDRGKNSIFYSG